MRQLRTFPSPQRRRIGSMLLCGMARKALALGCLVTVVAIFATTAFAATYERFLPAGFYPYGTSAGSSFNSIWVRSHSYTTTQTDRTVTLIDNVTYSWHGTTRGTATEINARWDNSTVKKGHCILHTSGTVACTVFDYL